MIRLVAAGFLALAFAVPGWAQDEAAQDAPAKQDPAEPEEKKPETPEGPETVGQKAGYALGIQLYEAFGEELDLEWILEGFESAKAGRPPLLERAAMQQAVRDLQMARQNRLAEANMEKAKHFLEVNGKKEGVTTLDSGLQYSVQAPGDGAHPAATDTVTVHYHGTLTDGTVFDSSVQRKQPATFALNRVIKGWTEGVQLMKPGAKFTFTIPPDLAYGPRGRPGIPPNSVLVFEIELIQVAGK